MCFNVTFENTFACTVGVAREVLFTNTARGVVVLCDCTSTVAIAVGMYLETALKGRGSGFGRACFFVVSVAVVNAVRL